MWPQNKEKVLLQNTAPPGCPPQGPSQFVHPLAPKLQPLFPQQSHPSSHPPHTSSLRSNSWGSWLCASESSSDSVLHPSPSPSVPDSPNFLHQDSPSCSFQQSHSTPPLTRSSAPSQTPNDPPHSQSPAHGEGPPSSTYTFWSARAPSKQQAWHWHQSRGTTSPGEAEGCVASGKDPAEFKDPGALAQALVVHLGPRRIAQDLRLLLLQRLWLGNTDQAPVVEYPVCLVCLQLRSPSCPAPRYKTGPHLLAFPQLLPCAKDQESGPLRLGIGFGLRLPRGEAKALHLFPKKRPEKPEPQPAAAPAHQTSPPAPRAPTPRSWAWESSVPGTFSQTGSLKSAGPPSPNSTQCPGSPPQAPKLHKASQKPRPHPAPKTPASPEPFPRSPTDSSKEQGLQVALPVCHLGPTTPSPGSNAAAALLGLRPSTETWPLRRLRKRPPFPPRAAAAVVVTRDFPRKNTAARRRPAPRWRRPSSREGGGAAARACDVTGPAPREEPSADARRTALRLRERRGPGARAHGGAARPACTAAPGAERTGGDSCGRLASSPRA
ncbi:proline-rich protein 30 [Sorex fumeus]|uniref:proline-rich protein 30 n=1 Tax=Sorex fumeus TaxID=62283 RepID=UPI0024AD5B6F|nr:proline-rich protein 30 [Sorex fumeus]